VWQVRAIKRRVHRGVATGLAHRKYTADVSGEQRTVALHSSWQNKLSSAYIMDMNVLF